MSEAPRAAIEAALARILPGDVVVAAGCIGEVPLALHPEEQRAAAGWAVARQQEFFTGRSLARAALQRLGAPDEPLLAGASRAPRWPRGVTGAISHTRSLCAVAVADVSRVRAIGIDVEPARPLERALWDEICTEEERRWIAARAADEQGLWVRWFFSAKETVYKLQSPVTGVFLEFHDVGLRALDGDLRDGHFRASIPSAVRERLAADAIAGAHATVAEFLLTAAALPA
jgi:4'-phosphopantetheinyl transferase EntD